MKYIQWIHIIHVKKVLKALIKLYSLNNEPATYSTLLFDILIFYIFLGPRFHFIEKSSQSIYQNISFCILQKKVLQDCCTRGCVTMTEFKWFQWKAKVPGKKHNLCSPSRVLCFCVHLKASAPRSLLDQTPDLMLFQCPTLGKHCSANEIKSTICNKI